MVLFVQGLILDESFGFDLLKYLCHGENSRSLDLKSGMRNQHKITLGLLVAAHRQNTPVLLIMVRIQEQSAI